MFFDDISCMFLCCWDTCLNPFFFFFLFHLLFHGGVSILFVFSLSTIDSSPPPSLRGVQIRMLASSSLNNPAFLFLFSITIFFTMSHVCLCVVGTRVYPFFCLVVTRCFSSFLLFVSRFGGVLRFLVLVLLLRLISPPILSLCGVQVRLLGSASQHPSSDGLRRRGRVPSFYTSRSLVNLSGLSGKRWSQSPLVQPQGLPPALMVFLPFWKPFLFLPLAITII